MVWEELDDFLIREFTFKDFSEAVEFVNKIKDIANEMNHHPNILMHSYNKVQVMLKSHDVNDITEKDLKLAEKIDKIK
jgi:4a-hydroxytetrahydrobiopterin dehydratase